MLNKIIHNREEMISQYQEAITKESNKIQLDKFEFDERGSVMKVLKISGWILFAISVILYLTGIFSGEFFINAWGLLYYGTSMKAFWLTVLSASCLLLAIILMLVVLTIKKRKS